MAPPITVVIPTRDRPELVRQAIGAVLDQDYDGTVTTLVVHDGVPQDNTLERNERSRPVRVLSNGRAPGLAGARNSGVLSSSDPLVGFCDDDDTWRPDKLRLQVQLIQRSPAAVLCSSGITVDFDGRVSERGQIGTVSHQQLLRSRMAMLHSSTFLIRREALLDSIGLVDERIPGGQNEDWDLLLRASSVSPIAVVDQPLVRVRWGRASHYARRWDTKAASLEWMLRHHPDLSQHAVGSARVFGQIAFAHASAGRRAEAMRWAMRASRRHPLEWRAVAASIVSTRLISGDRFLEILHRFGRGV